MISTVMDKGTLQFMSIDESFTAGAFLKFLEWLTNRSDTKISQILDNIRVHHAKILFYLPSCSLELNPDELLNQDDKSNAVGRNCAKSLTEMKNKITKFLFEAQNCPNIVKSYF